MKVDYIEETSVRKALAFEIEPDVVTKEIETHVRAYARKAKLPGFRPGKAPLAVIKQRFRSELLEEAAEAIVNRVVIGELEGRGLQPLANPHVVDLKIDENIPMTFRAVFETLPHIEAPDYKGLSVKTRQAAVADADVDRELDRLREQAARFDPIEGRATREGDFAVLDLRFNPVGGERGGQDDNTLIEIGSADNHADLNAALVGMNVGESREVTITYAADHPSQNLAGQTWVYAFTLKGIKERVLPQADDDFAKDLGTWGTLTELRDHLRAQMSAAENAKIESDLKNALIDGLVERAEFEVPETLIQRHMNARTEGAVRALAYQGIDPMKAGVNWSEFRDSQRDVATKAAKADLLLDTIAKKEGIEALDAEVEAEIDRMATHLKRSREAVRSKLEKEGDLPALRLRIREDKTLDLIKSNARLSFE